MVPGSIKAIRRDKLWTQKFILYCFQYYALLHKFCCASILAYSVFTLTDVVVLESNPKGS